MKKILLTILLLLPFSVFAQFTDCESGIIALQINPDQTVTIIQQGTEDNGISWPPKGWVEERILKQGEPYRNVMDDHVYDYTILKEIKNGNAIIERTEGFHFMENRGENTCPFEIKPFTLIDYANTPEKEKEVWYGIVHIRDDSPECFECSLKISKMIQEFIEYSIRRHGKKEFISMLNYYMLDRWTNKKLLVHYGADVNTVDSNGENALFNLVRSENNNRILNPEALFLAKTGIDVYHKNKQGETVIDILGEKSELSQLLKCQAATDTEVIDYKCVKKCPPNSFRQEDYACIDCGDLKTIKPHSTRYLNECNLCPNRFLQGEYCMPASCPSGYIRKNHIDTNGIVQDHQTSCISCDSLEGVASDECNLCSNRVLDSKNRCRLKECPVGYLYSETSHSCRLCDEPDSINTFECERCSNRIKREGICPFKKNTEKCPDKCILKECPEGYFQYGIGEGCLPCDDTKFPELNFFKCSSCSGWEKIDGKCIQKQ